MMNPKAKKAAMSVLDEILGKCDDSAASKFKKPGAMPPGMETPDEDPKEGLEDPKEEALESPEEEAAEGADAPEGKLEDMDLEDLLALYSKLK